MNEIEDVVSSVRRLVSPEARPRPLSRDLGLEKLILTPALQVVPEPVKAKKASVKPTAKATAAPSRRPSAETPKPDPIRVEPVVEPVAEAEWEAPFWTDPDPSLAEMALQAEEAVVVTSPAPVVPLAVEAKKPVAARKAPAPKAAAAAVEKPAKPALKSVKPAPKPRKAAAKPAPVVTKPVLELVRSEPEAIAVDVLVAVAEPAVAEQAASPLALVAELQVEAVTETAAPTDLEEELVVNGVAQVLTDRDGNPVSLLDEAELIQMVRRVIREELQDVLGEKITRNIRKLVRAEINRVLTSQTLE